MLDPKLIDDLAKRLSDSVPGGLRGMQEDMQRNFRAVLQTALERLDLVTREDFEVQAGLLRRTRQKLGALEKRLATLEGSLTEDAGE